MVDVNLPSLEQDPGLELLVTEYQADMGAVSRLFPLSASRKGRDRKELLVREWMERLDKVDFGALGPAGKVDHVLFANHLEFQLSRSETERWLLEQTESLVSFVNLAVEVLESRTRMATVDGEATAALLERLAKEVQGADTALGDEPEPTPFAHRAAELARELEKAFEKWEEHSVPYDPEFAWWVEAPLGNLRERLKKFCDRLDALAKREDVIPGHAVGREALLSDLLHEGIPYSPEELISIGEREYLWCEARMREASREMGFDDDWKAALEHVKDKRVPPGRQTDLVNRLAEEAIEYVESKGLLTVPPLAKETWRMEMMSAERQLVSPFFLGGETIIVSYPTRDMSHQRKQMSMRGNNPHFSRATVQHELIPGHHLQFFMLQRHRPYRRTFGTPFWIEGWTLYWELLLWNLGFPVTPEDRIGMLFWRMHRCVRVVFSLRYHLGELTTADCVEMLVDRVGHERANAEGEVRRSFNGSYPPLYQAAYLIGGLQVMALRREIVDGGRMSDREFHDAFLRQNQMPIAMLRKELFGEPVEPGGLPVWHFDGER